MRTYLARYEYDGRAWIVRFRDLDISTFGRSLRSAKRYAREALAAYLEIDDVAAANVDVRDEVSLPPAVDPEVERLTQMRAESNALRARVAGETRRAALDLRRAGFSTRDVGEILGISGARVAQIEHDPPAA